MEQAPAAAVGGQKRPESAPAAGAGGAGGRRGKQQADQSRREQAESVAAASEREVVELQRAANEEHEALLEKLKKMGKKGLDAALKKRALSTEGSAKEVKQRLLGNAGQQHLHKPCFAHIVVRNIEY